MSAVRSSQIRNVASSRLLGNLTAESAAAQELAPVSVLSWLGLSASGVTDGKALIASSNSIAWSPSAAALLPDTLPAAGTLLSYGGSRQLAAGGNVSHAGDITLTGGANGIYISPSGVNKGLIYFSAGQNRLYGQPAVPWVIESDAGFKVRNSANSADAAITAGGMTVASGGSLTIANSVGNSVTHFMHSAGSTFFRDFGGDAPLYSYGTRDSGWGTSLSNHGYTVNLSASGTTKRGFWIASGGNGDYGDVGLYRLGVNSAAIGNRDGVLGSLSSGAITASGDLNIGNNTMYVGGSGYFRFADLTSVRPGGNWGLLDVAPMDNNRAGTLRLYNNLHSLTNYERLELGQDVAGDAFIRTSAGGTGTRRGLTLDATTITASGAVNVTPKVEVIYSGTTPATPAYGSIALVGTTFSSSPYIGGGLCSDRLQGLWFPDGVPVMGTRTSLAAGATFTTWLSFGSTTGVGGQTSSFPGFNASGTTFRIRLADNSADAPLSAGAITASGAIISPTSIGDSATISGMTGIDLTTANCLLFRQGGTRWFGLRSIGAVFANAGGIGFAANGSASAFTSVVYEVSNGWRLQADNGLSIRNLANSADAALTCGAITASGNVLVNSAYTSSIPQLIVRGTNTVSALRLQNSTTGSATSDGFGVETSDGTGYIWNYESSPIIFGTTNTTRLTISAAGDATFNKSVMETPTQSSINPTTVDIPTGQRRGWYNSTLAEFRDWVNIGGTLLKSAAYT